MHVWMGLASKVGMDLLPGKYAEERDGCAKDLGRSAPQS